MSHARLVALFTLPAWLFAIGIGAYTVVERPDDAAFGYCMVAAGVVGLGVSALMIVTGRPRRWGHTGQEQQPSADQPRRRGAGSWWDISF